MNIYLVSQDKVTDYDTYDFMVVVAESEEAAKDIHPLDQKHYLEERLNRLKEMSYLNDYGLTQDVYDCWCERKSDVEVILLGTADPKHYEEPQIIITSFNAG